MKIVCEKTPNKDIFLCHAGGRSDRVRIDRVDAAAGNVSFTSLPPLSGTTECTAFQCSDGDETSAIVRGSFQERDGFNTVTIADMYDEEVTWEWPAVSADETSSLPILLGLPAAVALGYGGGKYYKQTYDSLKEAERGYQIKMKNDEGTEPQEGLTASHLAAIAEKHPHFEGLDRVMRSSNFSDHVVMRDNVNFLTPITQHMGGRGFDVVSKNPEVPRERFYRGY